jgi:hypothetical protein
VELFNIHGLPEISLHSVVSVELLEHVAFQVMAETVER